MSGPRVLLAVALAVFPAWVAAATFPVTKTADTNDGVCDSDCSLREAVLAANAAAGPDRIVVPAGTYTLSLGGDDQTAAAGDLDLTEAVEIAGAGAPRTVLDGGGALIGDHAFEVLSGVTATITGLTIRDANSGSSGGALLVAGQLTFRDSVVAGSTATDGGAVALTGSGGSLTVEKVTLRYNRASGNGGAIALLCSSCTATLTNTTLSGNRADGAGGAIYQGDTATVTLANTTLTANTADEDDDGVGTGGGIGDTGGSVTLRNSIVAGNLDRSGAAPDCAGSGLVSEGYNLIGDATGCALQAGAGDQFGADPLLGPLACNQGRIDTHALLGGSPALDAANPAVPGSGGSACAAKDQRSFLRPWDGDDDSTAVCDIGALETCAPSFADTAGNFAEAQIKDMYCRGITSGCSSNPLNFCPSSPTTRAQVAVFLVRFVEQTPSGVAYNQYFDDIADDLFAPFVNRLFELGITAGCGTRLFCPGSLTTRQQAAVFLIRTRGETPSSVAYNQYFDDIANDGFAPYVNRFFELGLTSGCGPRQFCPMTVVTRAQMAVFLAEKACLADQPPVANDDSVTVDEEILTTIDVLANDSDPDGGPISVLSVTQPANGTVVITNGGAGVTYQGNDDFCDTTPDTFDYTLSPGGSSATVSVTVTCVNDAPVVTTTGGSASFTEDGGPVAVDTGVTVTDSDSSDLASATVTITNPQDGASEVLGATACAGLTLTPGLNSLSITGSQPLATYVTCLQSVTYNNSSQAPGTTARAISFVANDGTASSNTATKSVSVTGVNDEPALTTSGGTTSFTEDGGAVTVDAGVSVTDVDSPNLASATVTITNLLDTGQEALAATVAGTSITASYVAPTLALTGSDTVANYQQVLRSVSYNNASNAPSTTDRTIDFTANDGTADSNTASKTVSVTAANDAPVVTTTGGVTSFTEDGGAVAVDAGVTVTDADNANLASATVTITNPQDGASEVLGATACAGLTVTPGLNSLSITGSQPLATYVTCLQSVTYNNSSQAPGTTARVISFVANDGTDNSNTANKSVSVTAVNDAPVIARPVSVNATEDVEFGFTGGDVISVTDVDAGTATNFQVTLGVSNGSLHVTPAAGLTITGNDTASVTLSGTVAVVSTGLGTLKYTGDSNFNGSDTVAINASDNGNSGTGGTQTDSESTTINIAAVNDKPVAQNKSYNSQANMRINGLTGLLTGVTDPDSGTGSPACNPSFMVASLTPVSCGGCSVANLDAATGTFDLLPGPGFTGMAALSYTVVDSGCPGSATSDPAAITVTVAGPVIWFVTGSTGSDSNSGVLGSPFATVGKATTTIGASTNHKIFVYSGTYSQGATLNEDGWLIGEGVTGASFDSVFGIMPPTGTVARPGIGGTRPTLQNTVTMGTSSQVKGLNITAGANTGLTASSKTGLATADVSVTTTTGIAVHLSGSGGAISLTSVSANGGSNGIVLENTTGSFTVTGDGGDTNNGSGGTITSMVGPDMVTNTDRAGSGVYLRNAASVSLGYMNLTSNQNAGLFGDDVTDLTLTRINVTNNGNSATGADAGLRFFELLGSCAFDNIVVSGSSEDNIRLTPTSGTLTNLAIMGGTIGPNSATTGGNGITLFGTGTATWTLNVSGVTFQSNRGSALLSNQASSASHTVNVGTSIFRDNGKGVSLATNTSADLTFGVSNNTEIVRSLSNALELVTSFDSTSAMQVQGTLSGNVVGDANADSGSAQLHGIALDLRGDERSILAVSNNSVRHVDLVGLFVNDADFGTNPGSPSDHDLTMRDNSVQDIDDNSGFPCGAPFGTLVDMRHTTTACLDMAGNTSAESPQACGAAQFRLRQRDTSAFQLERLDDGDGTPNELITSTATVASHVLNENDPGGTANVTLVSGFTETTNGTCVKP